MSDLSNEEEEEEESSLVIENGTYQIKAGFAGDDAPRAIFPTVVSRPYSNPTLDSLFPNRREHGYVGDEGFSKKGILEHFYPIKYGIINNYDDMKDIWHHTFYNELRIQPEEHSVVMIEKPFQSKQNREQVTKIMFETFNIPSLSIINTAICSLFAYGQIDGIVIDSGYDTTECIPIYESYLLKNASTKIILEVNMLRNI